MFKVNNKDTKNDAIGVVLLSLLLTLNIFLTPCSSGSIVNFEQVNADWVAPIRKLLQTFSHTHPCYVYQFWSLLFNYS